MFEITRIDGLISRQEAADLCGVSAKTITRWICTGRLPVGRREGRYVFVSIVDVARAEYATAYAAQRLGPDRPRPPAPDSVVYYLRFSDRIKIGTTTCLAQRLASVPHDELLATEPGDVEVERARHRQFAPFRIKGEWFSPATPLLVHIARLAVAGSERVGSGPDHCAPSQAS